MRIVLCLVLLLAAGAASAHSVDEQAGTAQPSDTSQATDQPADSGQSGTDQPADTGQSGTDQPADLVPAASSDAVEVASPIAGPGESPLVGSEGLPLQASPVPADVETLPVSADAVPLPPALPGEPVEGLPSLGDALSGLDLPNLPTEGGEAAGRAVAGADEPSPRSFTQGNVVPAAVGIGTAAAVGFVPSLRRVLAGALRKAVGLLGLGGLGLFSRIRHKDVLEHTTRAAILDAVTAAPGLSLQDLQRRMGLAWGTTVHHVRLMERHGQLVSIRQGPRRLLYAANTPEARSREDLALLKVPTAQRIAQAVQESPGIHQGALCEELGLRAPAASKHLSRFEAAGLVEVTRDGGRCCYGPTPRLQNALLLAMPPAAVVEMQVAEPVAVVA